MTATRVRTSRRDAKTMPGRQELHSFETGSRPRHRGKGEDMIEPRGSGRGGTIPEASRPLISEAKEQPVALSAPEKRRDAEAIAAQMQVGAAAHPTAQPQIVRAAAPTFLR